MSLAFYYFSLRIAYIKNIIVVFLCPLSANVYGLEFLSFKIRNGETKRLIFEASKENVKAATDKAKKKGLEICTMADPDSFRKIAYEFDVDVLQAPCIVTGKMLLYTNDKFTSQV